MEAMDEMFVPYKEMFESPKKVVRPPISIEKESFFKGNWMWIAVLLVILILLAAFVLRKIQTEEDSKPIQFSSLQPSPLKLDLKPDPLKVEIPKVEIPKVEIPKVEPKPLPKPLEPAKPPEPAKPLEIVDYENTQLLAKGVGMKLRDLLLKHKQIPPLQVAEIVSATVRVLLGENERSQAEVVKVEKKPEPKPERSEPRLPEPRKDGPKVKAPELLEEQEPEEPKRGKINADTDPALLKLLKERGMSN